MTVSPAPVIDTGTGQPAEPESLAPEGRRASARALLAVIGWYQLLRAGRPTGCRYVPSCSSYAVTAVDRFGAARGGLLALRRLARCGPWAGHGFDPVPDRSAP